MSTDNNNFNADEMEAPGWLNQEFLQQVLVQHFKDSNITVNEVTMSPASAKGDHYASVMFRAKVEYSSQKRRYTKSLIIKTMPETEGHKKDFLDDSKIFQTEIIMYTEILPLFESILRAAGEEVRFGANCVYHSLEPRQVMIFEDLVTQGYQVIRDRNISLDELREVLAKLAKWQAVSFKLLKEQPELFDRLCYDVTTINNFLEQDFMTEAFPNFLEMLSQEEQLKKYRKYFEPMRETILTSWQDVIREYRENRQPNAYYVLGHGDFHMRNLMYRDGECLLLDFQMSNVGSIANDIQYARYMLLSVEERKNNWDELVYHYFDTFVSTLSKIGYQGEKPSLVEFRKQLFARRSSDYMLLTIFLPGAYHMCEGKDPGDLMLSKDRRKELYQNTAFKKELEHLLPRMLHEGYFKLP